ncbi:MAG: hypothetical protein ACO31E_04055 [Phycisphaerales bacterium]
MMRRRDSWPAHGALVCCLATMAAGLPVVAPCALGQTLALDAPDEGPAIPEKNGVLELALMLEAEVDELVRGSASLVGEAQVRARAASKVRSIAAYLLRSGAARPWSESAPAAAGARLALLVPRIDALIDRALAGRDGRDELLPIAGAQRAMRLLETLAETPSDPLRRALVAPKDRLARETTRALAVMLAPLAELATIIEDGAAPDPWPVLDALVERVSGAARATVAAESAADLRASAAMLADEAARDAANAAIDAFAQGDASSGLEARLLAEPLALLAWVDAARRQGPPLPFDAAALDATAARMTALLAQLASSPLDPETVAACEALEFTMPAAFELLAMRKEPAVTEAARRQLSDAAAGLLAAEAGGSLRERDRARAARRILDACATAGRLEQSIAKEAPRDLREAMRGLDRDARIAVKALPEAFAAMCVDPAGAGDPESLSALGRIRSIEIDRERIVLLQSVIDSVGSVRPGAGRAFAAVARRVARLLEDPLKREEAQRAFATIESLHAASFPLPYEVQLKERTPRATELAGGVPEQLVARAAEARNAWCEALGRGDLGGVAAKRLDHAARLCRALADLDRVIEPIDRAAGDHLALWGPWSTRRSMIAPATQDLVARAVLATRSFLAASNDDAYAGFERDLIGLETAIPLVRLTAALERKVTPALPGDPNSVGASLAPLISLPSTYAYLASQWARLAILHRAMIEAEFARRNGDLRYRDELLSFLARIAREVHETAFGAPVEVRAIPGFDGGDAATEPTGRRGRTRSGSK